MKHSLFIKIGIFLGIFLLGYVLVSASLHFRIGNIFFGQVPSLYNVALAEFFFNRATNPIVGDVPPYAYHQLSRTHFIQGALNHALFEANRELEMYPDHGSTYYIIGLTLGYLNREEEAIEAFGKYIAYNPESWAARNDRAWLQFRIGDIDGALETIQPVAIYLDNPWIQNTYGTLLLNQKRYAEAEIAFLNAKNIADQMTEESWGRAYPGNDPRIYELGLNAMRASIDENLEILATK